ncbi:MAG: heme-copper oxidase subunit III [Thermoleophilaceae bacterium]|nr:heme-copper oxidase subunit III [Thermoleophilaceae bacterium]
MAVVTQSADALTDRAPTGLESLDVRKLGMWAFLGSECVFFGSLISMYFVNRPLMFSPALEAAHLTPKTILNIPFTGVLAFILLCSSLTMVLALNAMQQSRRRAGSFWLLATAFLGMLFLGGQAIEFIEIAHEGITLQNSVFGQSFLLLTGFHGTHVFVGIIWLLSCIPRALRGGFHAGNYIGPEICGLYWHFVDVVWVVIFTIIYLI